MEHVDTWLSCDKQISLAWRFGVFWLHTHSTVSIRFGGHIVERFLDQHDGW